MAFTHGNHVAAGRLLRREADRLRFQKADQRVGLVDGAAWIREQMQLHFAELDGLGLDFYHLSENVHRARRKVFGEESPEGQAWADELMHVFKHEGMVRPGSDSSRGVPSWPGHANAKPRTGCCTSSRRARK